MHVYMQTCECLNAELNPFLRPDVDQMEKTLFESGINIQMTRKDATGPHMQYTGFFRAPVAGNFSFLLAADDNARVWGMHLCLPFITGHSRSLHHCSCLEGLYGPLNEEMTCQKQLQWPLKAT